MLSVVDLKNQQSTAAAIGVQCSSSVCRQTHPCTDMAPALSSAVLVANWHRSTLRAAPLPVTSVTYNAPPPPPGCRRQLLLSYQQKCQQYTSPWYREGLVQGSKPVAPDFLAEQPVNLQSMSVVLSTAFSAMAPPKPTVRV